MLLAQEKFERFGNYILLERLASGGMAEIYLSKKIAAEGVQKFVAVKRILSQHSASEDFIRMFKDEAKIAVNLSHSNVVSIYDFGVENSQLYLVMEYMEGKNLRQILNRLKQLNKRFSISHIAYITKLIAAGLDHAHRLIDATTGQPLNIIHRDMSPQNVMVSFEGEVKIIDFGIAKSTTQEESTRVGTLKGKFGYMSPEQIDGMEVDARTDIFALGIMLWEMLSEQRLFLTNNEMSTLRKIRDCKIPSLREMDPNIPVELEKIVMKALARNKAQRYQTAAELQKDLQSFLNRYNPDFSSQDFSEFIKELYSEEIVDARKRQVAYSKVEVPLDPLTQKASKLDAFTQSMTFSSHDAEKVSFSELSLQKKEEGPPDLEEGNLPKLSTNNSAQKLYTTPPPTVRSQTFVGTPNTNSEHTPFQHTQTSFRVPQQEETQSSPLLGIAIVLFAGLIGIFAVVNETQPKLVAGPCNSLKNIGVPIGCYTQGTTLNASTDAKTTSMRVASDPSGAYIYLNNSPTNQRTPADIPVEIGKPFVLTIASAGYRTESQKFQQAPPTGTAYFKLTSVPSGTISVRIVGGEAFMGKTKLSNGQQFSVEANKPIVFTARNPLNGKEVEQTVTVKPNEHREVILSPR
ncbi:MAG: serine/threonine protein kinase [Bdellovibrionaceae bacterium]|nr:serine/threonine protein kinase [Pseudobdellovibrionaceae bacterium]